jgi:translocation and assembly module TamB
MFKLDVDIYHQTLNQMFESFQTTSDISSGIYFNTQKHVGNSLRYLVNLTPGNINLLSNSALDNAIEKIQSEKVASNLKIHKAISQGVLDNGSLSSSTELSFNKNSFINLQLKALNLNTDNKADDYIDASLKAEINGLRFLSYILKLPINLDGNIKADFELSGSADHPQFNGQGSIKDLMLDLIPIGVQAENGHFDIQASSPSNLAIKGDISIDKSKLYLTSEIDYNLLNSDFTLATNINAKEIQLVDLPQIKMTISPDINITKQNSPIQATGTVLVNQANIYAEDFKTTANANNFSSDIVYVNNRNQIIQQNKTLPVYAEIEVDLGDKTSLHGFGFNSYLTGNLKIFSYPGQLTTALGDIGFKDGAYQNYGKRFEVTDKSNLNFNYSPISNPNLDITALYHLPADLLLANNAPSKIGVKIQGTAEQPKLTLFSVPSLSQANILAYIIVGQPLQSDQGQQYSNAMQSAALAFALNGGSQSVLKDIQDTLGINELSFGTINSVPMMSDSLSYANNQNNAASQSQTALFIGKSITSKFHISYGFSIFNGQQELDTTYKFTEHWSLRTDYTTLDTGADIIYQITP